MRVTLPAARADAACLIEPIIHEPESRPLHEYWWVLRSRRRRLRACFREHRAGDHWRLPGRRHNT
ncbi:MAG: hypothetical protein AB7N91_23820 [Candidatus Tectimicrobiota bacterium]